MEISEGGSHNVSITLGEIVQYESGLYDASNSAARGKGQLRSFQVLQCLSEQAAIATEPGRRLVGYFFDAIHTHFDQSRVSFLSRPLSAFHESQKKFGLNSADWSCSARLHHLSETEIGNGKVMGKR